MLVVSVIIKAKIFKQVAIYIRVRGGFNAEGI